MTRQAPTDLVCPPCQLDPDLRRLGVRFATYQADNDNDCLVPRKLVVVPGERDQFVRCACRSTPVHARDSTSQQHSRYDSLPPRVGPPSPEDKEERQRDDARGHRNQSRPYDVGDIVNAHVVVDGGIAQVVHAADGSASKRAPDGNTPPRDLVVGPDGHKSSDQDKNWHKEGKGREPAGISNLK